MTATSELQEILQRFLGSHAKVVQQPRPGGVATDKLLSVELTDPVPLDDLPALAAGILGRPDLLDALPEELRRLDGLALTALQLDPAGGDVSQARFVLGLGWLGEWRPIPALGVSSPGVMLVGQGVHSEDLQVTVFGDLLIEDMTLSVTVAWPQGTVQGCLGMGSSLSLGPLLRMCHFDGAGLDDLELNRLELLADIRGRSFDFAIGLHDVWKPPGLGDKFAVNDVVLDVHRTAGGLRPGVSGSIVAGVTVLGEDITLRAEHPGPGLGWRFLGTCRFPPKPLSDIAAEVKRLFGATFAPPAVLDGFAFTGFSLGFETLGLSFALGLEGKLDLGCGAKNPVFRLDVRAVKAPADPATATAAGWRVELTGTLHLGALRVTALFHKDPSQRVFAAVLDHQGQDALKLKDLVAAVADPGTGFPDITLPVRSIALAVCRPQIGAKGIALSLALAKGADLSRIPLVAGKPKPGEGMSLVLQPTWVSAGMTEQHYQTAAELLPPGALPQIYGNAPGAKATTGTTAGQLHLTTSLTLGDRQLQLDVAMPQKTANTGAAGITRALAAQPVRPPSADGVQWIPALARFGPAHIAQVGLKLDAPNDKLWLLIDAGIELAGVTFSLLGLGAGLDLTTRELSFSLQGLGLSVKRGPIDISGAFLRFGDDDFAGKLAVRLKAVTLGALGAYARVDGHDSLMLYAFVNFPLGGPVFFFVEGLAGGFGYNRDLLVPAIDRLHTFPLVTEAMGDAPPPTGQSPDPNVAIATELRALRAFVPPKLGTNFIAIGLKFNSFRLLHCFALVVVKVGSRFVLDVFGMARLRLPPDLPLALAQVELMLVAHFDPDRGEVLVAGVLTPNSWVLSGDCVLRGGFAYRAWMSGRHAGDFVVSIGGYHPHFRPPAHYPMVPRLGFTWALDSQTYIKGDAYFAMTPDALMAGGTLEATWDGGNVGASFKVGADFLIRWQPLWYEASFYVEISARAELLFVDIETSIGARVEIEGPPLRGKAEIDLDVVSFEVEFGDHSQGRPADLTWGEFRAQLLPAGDDEIVTLNVVDGMVRRVERSGTVTHIVNPKELLLETSSVVPSLAGTTDPADPPAPLYIRPMGGDAVTGAGQSQDLTLNGSLAEAVDHFVAEELPKSFPLALWGPEGGDPLAGGPATVDAVGGLRLRPKAPTRPAVTHIIPRSALEYDVTPELLPPAVLPATRGRDLSADRADRGAADRRAALQSLGEAGARELRAGVLADLGLAGEPQLFDGVIDALDTPPRVYPGLAPEAPP